MQQPEVSILLVTDSLAPAMKALRGFAARADPDRLEYVIVSRNGAVLSAVPLSAEGLTRVRTLSIEGDSYDRAEACAVQAATAPWVVFALPSGHPEPGYVDAVKAAAESGEWGVVGPAISICAPRNGWSWTVSWILYGPWLHDPPRGEMASVAGHHSLFRREALLALGEELEGWLVAGEPLLGELRKRGHRFLLEPAAVVDIAAASSAGEFVECVFRNARLFAGKRCRKWPVVRRLVYGVGSPLIPLVRLPRIWAQIRRAGRQREAWPRLPFLLAGLAISAAGEMLGYLGGPGGAWRFEPRTGQKDA